MTRTISIIKKEEAYSYDELAFILENIIPNAVERRNSLSQVFMKLTESVEKSRTSQAVFFMPKESFDIIALLQGNNAVCEIKKDDIDALSSAFDFIENRNDDFLYSHLQKKISVLKEYLQSGRAVYPVPIQADDFCIVKIS